MPPIFSEEEKEQIRRRLLEKASEQMLEKGIKNTKISELAKMVGIGKGTFYHFFSSKEMLVMEVMSQWRREKLDAFQQLLSKKGTMTIDELFEWYQSAFFNPQENLIYKMTAEDEEWLKKTVPSELMYNQERDEQVIHILLDHTTGIKENLDYGVIANFPKIMAYALENKDMMNEKALKENFRLIMKALYEYVKA
ncbi:TetR family transcriptional regulator [Kineothrix alysoides]|uniref:TetR family transcriptional regulator n=1 Tax=Kineothrix alysoides TaxID=1469948 RepID=A0A4R1QNC7_9FIRM|nr:TetR/AcrR family transcriptional regulator [Kineothrix alysoides]TCL55258.1 TetR family transcriptional regulator [Kineothrix alysoides]